MNRDHHVLWEVSNEETLRELYPDRSSLYERARELQARIPQTLESLQFFHTSSLLKSCILSLPT